MTSTYLYQFSAVENSIHAHRDMWSSNLIWTISKFQISERGRDLIFSHQKTYTLIQQNRQLHKKSKFLMLINYSANKFKYSIPSIMCGIRDMVWSLDKFLVVQRYIIKKVTIDISKIPTSAHRTRIPCT
jgi:hypothetical protein